MSQKSEFARKVADLVFRLPPMPENIDKLLKAGAEADVRSATLLIAEDPGLCADLFHLTNACFATTEPIETIEEALAKIGLEPLVQLIGTCYANEVIRKEFSSLTHLNEYFSHSREIAKSCHILADIAGLPKHEREMYKVAGLIHDMGRLIIMIAADKTSAPLMGTSWEQMTSVIHSEQDVLGMNHCEIGNDVCATWNFSPILKEGILRHHTPLVNDDFSHPGALIFLAHFVATSDFTGEILAGLLPERIFAKLGINASALNKARERYARESAF